MMKKMDEAEATKSDVGNIMVGDLFIELVRLRILFLLLHLLLHKPSSSSSSSSSSPPPSSSSSSSPS